MYTYLIIDDEPLIRRGTKKKLEPLSHLLCCCGEASDGKEGLVLVEKLQPDIVILDMQMPVMDGTELLPALSSRFPSIALIVISGFQNFDYMKQAISSKVIDYILKPFSKEEIQQTVLKTIESLKHKEAESHHLTSMLLEKEEAFYSLDLKLLTDLLMGYTDSDASAVSSKKLSFINDMHHFVLFALYNQPEQAELPVPDWIERNGFSDLVLYLPDLKTPAFHFLLLFLPETSGESAESNRFIRQFLRDFVPWVEHFSSSPVIGISSIHADLSALHTAYSQSREALNTQPAVPGPDCYFFYRQPVAPTPILWEKQDEFLFRIESGQRDTVCTLTEELFAFYCSLPHTTLLDVKYHCEQLTYHCHTILNFYLKQEDTSWKSSANMQAIVNTLFSLEEIQTYYTQFFLNITSLLKNQSVYSTGELELIDQIRLYMQRNYQKDITQEFIASLFYMNRSYLSQLFKKQTNQKFVDYLNEIRIEKAKDLLLHSDRKMYQIARSVGYDNTKYFFRIFKKKNGLSPEQFRTQYADDRQDC